MAPDGRPLGLRDAGPKSKSTSHILGWVEAHLSPAVAKVDTTKVKEIPTPKAATPKVVTWKRKRTGEYCLPCHQGELYLIEIDGEADEEDPEEKAEKGRKKVQRKRARETAKAREANRINVGLDVSSPSVHKTVPLLKESFSLFRPRYSCRQQQHKLMVFRRWEQPSLRSHTLSGRRILSG